ncbi:hypothetical protein [Pseudorhodobacter sp.]|uniref:hypothetical protein n=1 Tax=Pseudorhodobacter sp. TaxID=1934400 RepID=UPI002647A220|nr:hypothetical protein [Pseudorhodobacter sp.]MDN5786099.1 hypothetical protein [Pseudorhodobacter sp.]
MAAKRLGFDALLQPLLAIDNWRTGLLDGSLPATRFFAQDVFPLIEAALRDDKFTIARIAREKSPLLSPQSLKVAPDAGDELRKAQAAVSALVSLWDNQGKPTIGEVLDTVAMGGFFSIPDTLEPVVTLRIKNSKMAVMMESLTSDLVTGFDNLDLSLLLDPPRDPIATDTAEDDPVSEQTDALLKFLEAPFSQVGPYKSYVSGQAPFDSHQGVKGLEFDRVMVIMGDEEARGFMLSYDKLFGAKAPSETDQKNEASGKETGLDRTRRLLYVTCSRAEKSLALVAYTDNPIAVKAHVLANGWFNDDEVDI